MSWDLDWRGRKVLNLLVVLRRSGLGTGTIRSHVKAGQSDGPSDGDGGVACCVFGDLDPIQWGNPENLQPPNEGSEATTTTTPRLTSMVIGRTETRRTGHCQPA